MIISLKKFFKVHFNNRMISNNTLLMFSEDHIGRLKANNTSHQYDDMIAKMQIAHDEFQSALSTEHSNNALQQGMTIAVDNFMSEFKQAIRQKGGFISATWGKKSPEYQEFFPHGLDEYNKATKANIDTLMERFIKASNTHSGNLPPNFVTYFNNIKDNYINSRKEQLQKIAMVAANKTDIGKKRIIIATELNRNLLILASQNIGEPQKAKLFFDESIIK